jgi:hypothetical protein
LVERKQRGKSRTQQLMQQNLADCLQEKLDIVHMHENSEKYGQTFMIGSIKRGKHVLVHKLTILEHRESFKYPH